MRTFGVILGKETDRKIKCHIIKIWSFDLDILNWTLEAKHFSRS